MTSARWAFAAIVLLLAGLGLVLWHWAARRELRQATARHLGRRLAGDQDARTTTPSALAGRPGENATAQAPSTSPVASASAAHRAPGWLRAVATPRQRATAAGATGAAALAVGAIAGPVAAAGVLLMAGAAGGFAIWLRLQRFRQRLVTQLPGFIDAMVRLIRIGNSPQAAFQLSLAALKPPLREPMEHAGALARAGVDLEQALDQTTGHVGVGELHLLAAVLGLGVRYGGRADILLERTATAMRDSEQAGQELAAMSAETRLSAWILGLLPLGVGAIIMLTNADYVVRMWLDGTGRRLILGAFGLQALGVLLLYRLARLR